MRGKAIACLIILILLLSSCDETSSFFLDLDEQVQIITIKPGVVLSRGSEIPLVIEYNAQAVNPDNIVIEYMDGKGISLGKTEINQGLRSGQTLPSVIIPADLPPGLYSLKVRLKEQETLIKEENIPFFVLDGKVDIRKLTVYPPQLQPGGVAVVKADVLIPEGMDPWFRWKRGVQVIAEGPGSSGLETCLIPVPDTVGLYPVKLEVYPERPDSLYTPAWEVQAEIPVMHEVVGELDGLGRRDNYHVLFNFWGSLGDSGLAGFSQKGPLKLHNARPDVENGQYGLKLEPDTGLSAGYFFLPVRSGGIGPFTVTFKGRFSAGSKERYFLRTQEGSGQFALSVLVNKNGRFVARVRTGEKEQDLVLSGFTVEELNSRWVSLHAYPGGDSLILYWMVDGYLAEKGWFGGIPSGLSADGISIIGSEGKSDGVSAFIDELGVYVSNDQGRASRDPDVFAFAQRSRYRNRLIAAEGFDSDAFSDSGNWVIERSQLKVRPEGRFTTEEVLLPEGTGTIEMDLQIPAAGYQEGSRILFESKDSSGPLLILDLSDFTLRTPGQKIPIEPDRDGILTIYFRRQGSRILFSADSESEGGLPVAVSQDGLVLTLASGNKKDAIILNNLLIIGN